MKYAYLPLLAWIKAWVNEYAYNGEYKTYGHFNNDDTEVKLLQRCLVLAVLVILYGAADCSAVFRLYEG